MRTHLRAAARGLPRRQDLVALPRQRYDAAERRLGRALLANARAHGLHLARVQSRLAPRLLDARMTRARDRLEVLGRRATASLTRSTGPRRVRLERVAGRLSPQAISDRVARCRERMGVLEARLRQTMLNGVARHRRHLDGSAKLLASLSYHGVLQRGFALVRDEAGRSVRSVGQIAIGQPLDIELADGHVGAQTTRAGASRPAKPSSSPAAAPGRGKPVTQEGNRGGNQGSLF
jgi:exodeoxyribonuclease VII large subunit